MRFVAPPRDAVDPAAFVRPPLSQWRDFLGLMAAAQWPDVAALNGAMVDPGVAGASRARFVAQTPALLRDGLHYEQRIAERGQIATRERNWHDLLNALVWLRFPEIKQALNARQIAGIRQVGARDRSRAQCALTHFDEAGVIVHVSDPILLDLWDAHDWHGLFWRERDAWRDGRLTVIVFGHALLEHALRPGQLLVGKALAVHGRLSGSWEMDAICAVAAAIRSGARLNDPQELRPLPLSGIPEWHAENNKEGFYRTAPCFRPLRPGRRYPEPMALSGQP